MRRDSAMKLLTAGAGLLLLSGCIWDPANRQNQDSTTAIPLQGYSGQASQKITFSATNLTTGAPYTFPQYTNAASSPTINSGGYNMYSWSLNLTPAADFWAPQLTWNGLAHSQGRIELTGYAEYGAMDTFSSYAQTCTLNAWEGGTGLPQAGAECADGTTLTVFDNNGVGNGPETVGWTTYAGPYSGPAGTTWEIGYYPVQGKTIYGVRCHPTGTGTHRAVLINHGGYGGIDDVALSYCTGSAQLGWEVAMSAYRGQWVSVHVGGAILTTPVSGGNIELCLGEVTDVMRLLDIVRADTTHVDTSRVFMWGHSHGGCVTQKAVEHGALVNAAASLSGPTDFVNWSNTEGDGAWCILGQNATDNQYLDSLCGFALCGCSATTWATPTNAAVAFNWRSSAVYASDLAAVGHTVPFLIMHGTADPVVPADQACELAYNAWGAGSSTGTYWHRVYNGSAWTTETTPVPTSVWPDPLANPYCNQLNWSSAAFSLPGTVTNGQAGRFLVVYEGLDHGTILTNGQPMADLNAFANSATQ